MKVPYGEFNSMTSGHFKPLWDTFQWLGCQHYSQKSHIVVLGRLLHKSFRIFPNLWWGDQPLGSQYPRLFKVVTDKNILISSILGSVYPFSWNFNFHRNLSDSEIEDLESLMRSLDCLHLSPSLAKMDWVPPRSISDMMSINYKGFGLSKREIVLWQAACIALIWVVWRERNARIFEDKVRNSKNL
ncbi:hypothetical protein AAG906_020302 [Vitis piasezkii]